MPADIVETPTFGTPISAPIDADPRNAASVRVPFQATGDRLAFLEVFYNAIKAWMLGGTLTPAATVIVDLGPTFDLRLLGGGDLHLGDPSAAEDPVDLYAYQGLRDALTTADGPNFGRVPDKVQDLGARGTAFSFNPAHYTRVYVAASAAIDATIATSSSYVKGDRCIVHNHSGTHAVNVKKPNGVSLGTITPIGSGYLEVVYVGPDPDADWKLGVYRTS
jgi:hypothetical protein